VILKFKSPFLCVPLCVYLHICMHINVSLFNLSMSSIEPYSHAGLGGEQIEWLVRPDVCFETMNNKYMCALCVMYGLLPVQVSRGLRIFQKLLKCERKDYSTQRKQTHCYCSNGELFKFTKSTTIIEKRQKLLHIKSN
jgi:hypothetical protein